MSRKRKETPTERKLRLTAEIEAARRESRAPEFEADELTLVRDLLHERAERFADASTARMATLRLPSRGPTDITRRS